MAKSAEMLLEFVLGAKMKSIDAKTVYRKLVEKYLSVARQVADEFQADKDVIGCAKERYIQVRKENRSQHHSERGASLSRRS